MFHPHLVGVHLQAALNMGAFSPIMNRTLIIEQWSDEGTAL